MAYDRIEPFGEKRMDLRFGLMTANLLTPHVKKGKSVKVKDVTLSFERRQMNPDEIKSVLKGMTNGNSR